METFFTQMLQESEGALGQLRREIIANALDFFRMQVAFDEKFKEVYGISPDAWQAANPEARAEADVFVRHINAQFEFFERFWPGFREEVLARLEEDTENGSGN